MTDGVHPTPGTISSNIPITGFTLTRTRGGQDCGVGGGGTGANGVLTFANGVLVTADVAAESLKRLYLAGTMDRSQVLELLGMEGPDSNDPVDLYDLAYDERQREKLEAERERIRKTGKFY